MRISDWSSDVCSSDLPGVAAPRVLVVGLGDKAKFAVPQYLKAVADAARALKGGAGASALFTLSELEVAGRDKAWNIRSEEHTSELQSIMRISYAVFCLKNKKHKQMQQHITSASLSQKSTNTESIP